MLRRQYLAGVGVVAFAGCSGASTDSAKTETPSTAESDTDSPESPVVAHYKGLDENNFEAANAAIHSDSPRGEMTDESIEHARERSYSTDITEVVDRDTDEPVVVVTVTGTHDETEEEESFELRIEVRKEDGAWKMWKINN